METEKNGKAELLVAVGITGGRKSKYILKWALDQFVPEGNVRFKILHVYPKVTLVPTPFGGWVPVAEARDEVVNIYKQEIESKKKKALLPLKKALDEQKIKSDIVVVETDDIAQGLCLEVDRHSIRHIVIGSSSSTSTFSWKYMSISKMMADHNLSGTISEKAPSFCSVYIVADGKLESLRPSESKPTVISVHSTSDSSSSFTDTSSSASVTLGNLLQSKEYRNLAITRKGLNSSTNSYKTESSESLPNNLAAQNRIRKSRETTQYTFQGTDKSFEDYSAVNQSHNSRDSGSWVSDRTSPGGSFVGVTPTGSSVSFTMGGSFTATPPTGSSVSIPFGGSFTATPPTGSPGVSFVGSFADMTPPGSFVATIPAGSPVGPSSPSFYMSPAHQHQSFLSDGVSSQGQVYELEKLRIELKHAEKMYELSQNSVIDEKLNTSSKELEAKLTLEEEKAKDIARTETDKHKAGQSANAQSRRKEAAKAAEKTEENENRLKQLIASPLTQYQKFNWNDIMEATLSLSHDFKIGTGAFGTVYKCKLHHVTTAVKVLHSKNTVTNKQFLQELEILSTIRHPHLLLLLGAVPEESCLVYEYMENGSLDDRLFRKDNCPPLPWYERVRICWEVASALAFLHSTKPRPIIHRDLKPANILLDQHLVSKIGDAGLGTTMNVEPSDKSLRTLYKETSPVGTLCYIDPEYQRTGRVSTKSDVYALGIVILQLLTSKPAVGISYLIEDALEEGTLSEVLDQEAGEWPELEAHDLATIGLQCSELRGRDRPDLREIVLPTLEKLKEAADTAREKAANAPAALPAHFLCPISKDIMEDPYVAADGYTYDRVAIEQWMAENNTSPTTNLPLPHKFIMPNYTLLEAIKQWKSKQPLK